jgi:hypothetical protein
MSGKVQTRAEFVRKLTEMVNSGAKIEFFSSKTTENWPKRHNPAQDLMEGRDD